ncbi:unnamed protein product, partial [Linum tenue]
IKTHLKSPFCRCVELCRENCLKQQQYLHQHKQQQEQNHQQQQCFCKLQRGFMYFSLC